MAEPAWQTELINEARAISDRTDREYRDRRRFDRRWARYKKRAPVQRDALYAGWQIDEFGNYFRTIGS